MINLSKLQWIVVGVVALIVIVLLDVLIGTTVTPRLIATPTPTMPPPEILQFELISAGCPQVVDTGEGEPHVYRVYWNTDVTFQWQTKDATTVTLREEGSAPEEVFPNGHKHVWKITEDKTYVLQAKNATEEISAQIRVQVATGPHVLDSEDFTFVAWVYWQGGDHWQRIFDFGQDTDRNMFLTPRSGNDTLRFAITESGNTNEKRLNYTKPLTTGKWVHVAVTLAGDSGQLYVDGTRVASQTINLNPSDIRASQRWLGKSQYANDPYFNGKLDEVAVFDRALSQIEIQQVMACGWDALPGQALGLHMEENPATNGTLIADSSRQENHGTLVTADATNKSSPGYLGRALSFDGKDDYLDLTKTRYVRTLYVRPGGSGDCLSWASACELQTALEGAKAGDEIWVAGGVYTPTAKTPQADPRNATFQLMNGVALYGGFAGNETSRDERNWEENITILSGDIDGNDITENGVITDTANIKGENSYHVVTGSGTDDTAILDGFTITGGQANGMESAPCGPACGGGMYNEGGSPTLVNVVFSGNSARAGGGMWNYNNGSPSLTNVSFIRNKATGERGDGGGMCNDNRSSPTLTNVTFSSNHAGHYGGGMYEQNKSSPTLTNVTFSGNHADARGGGMCNDGGKPTLENVIFSGNSAPITSKPEGRGGGMYNTSSSPILTSTEFISNTAYFGGGMFNDNNSNPILLNVIFFGGVAQSNGGGMYNMNSNPRLVNITFAGNRAHDEPDSGGMRNTNSNPTLTNCILWGNSTPRRSIYNANSKPPIRNSLVQGDCPTGSTCVDRIINEDPKFEGADKGDLHLQSDSPAIDAGDNAVVADVLTDLDGNPRIACGVVDMGAYERQTCP
jgi:hypothetical protein